MRRRTAAVATLLALILVGTPAAVADGKKGKKKRVFEASGHVLLPNVPITWSEFRFDSCPSMPVTQGVTGHVVELPKTVAEPLYAIATATPNPVGGELSLVFFGAGCDSLGTNLSPALVPGGTRFIEVHDYFNANYDFTLTLDRL